MMRRLTANTIARHFFLVWVSLGFVVIINSVQKLPAVSVVGINTPNYNSLASHRVVAFSVILMYFATG